MECQQAHQWENAEGSLGKEFAIWILKKEKRKLELEMEIWESSQVGLEPWE